MKKRKTVFSVLFLLVLMGATWLALKKIGKEMDFGKMSQFVSAGNKVCLASAFLCMFFFVLIESFTLRCINRHLGYDTGFFPSVVYAAADTYYSAITPSAAGGQASSVFYMVRDGVPVSAATAVLLLNTIGYTASLDIIGVFTLLTNWKMFLRFEWSVQLLILLGIVIQFFALILFLMCMYRSAVVRRISMVLLRFLARIRIVRSPDRLEKKLEHTISQYANCISAISANPWIIVKSLLLNTLQRVSQILIISFVGVSTASGISFTEAMALQAFCMTGSNSVPFPGAMGAYEYLYLGTFGVFMKESVLIPSMMTARGISYYVCFIGCCILTWGYHAYTAGRRSAAKRAR